MHLFARDKSPTCHEAVSDESNFCDRRFLNSGSIDPLQATVSFELNKSQDQAANKGNSLVNYYGSFK